MIDYLLPKDTTYVILAAATPLTHAASCGLEIIFVLVLFDFLEPLSD